MHGIILEVIYVIIIYSNTEGKGDWSDDGIKLDDQNADEVFCLSDHLTSFVAFTNQPVSLVYYLILTAYIHICLTLQSLTNVLTYT